MYDYYNEVIIRKTTKLILYKLNNILCDTKRYRLVLVM